jgi:hypothetical protein
MADPGPLGELQERSGKTLAPRPLILYLGKKSPYLLRTPGLEFSKTRSYGRGPPGRRNRLDRHRAQAFFPYPNCAIRHSGVVLVGFGCLGAPDSTPFPPPSDHGASRHFIRSPFPGTTQPPLRGAGTPRFPGKMGWWVDETFQGEGVGAGARNPDRSPLVRTGAPMGRQKPFSRPGKKHYARPTSAVSSRESP